MSQIVAANTSAGFPLPAGSSLNVSGTGIVHVTPPGQNVREIVLTNGAQMIGPYRMPVFIGLNATTTASLAYDITVGYGTVGDPVTVPSISQLGLTVTATLAVGWVASGGWQWKRVAPNGTVTDIAGATSASYTQQAADLVAGTRIFPQPIGLTFSPIGITADGTVVVTPTPGTIGFSASTYSVGEGGGSVTVLVQRVGGSSGAASAVIATSSGSATSGADFTPVSLTLNWADGDAATKNVVIPILQDTTVEGNEAFNVTLSAATGATLGSPSSAVLTIVDDDVASTPGTVQFASATTSIGEGGGNAVLSVTRTGGSSGAASVGYATASGTATSGSDFTSTSGTLNWADGDAATKTISVPIIDDSTVESAETFTVTLSGATGVTLGSTTVNTVTINDNDAADTRPRFANGPANAAGTASVFDAFFGSATPLGGSTNGSKAGTLTAVGDGTNYCWIFIPASADASGLVVANASNLHGGFSGATYAGINPDGDPADPITVRQNYTNSGVAYHAYRRNGLLASGASASYTTS